MDELSNNSAETLDSEKRFPPAQPSRIINTRNDMRWNRSKKMNRNGSSLGIREECEYFWISYL